LNVSALKPPVEDGAATDTAATYVSGWPLDPKERCDFYHRVRVFPDDLAEWRKTMVARVGENRGLFRGILPGEAIESIRAKLDDGISYIREIARILALVYWTPRFADDKQSAESFASTPVDGHAKRALARLGPYRELGLSPDRVKSRTLLAELVPPNLRYSLYSNLAAHGRDVCRKVRPLCHSCELTNFCDAYRRSAVDAVEQSDAPTLVDLFAGAGGLSEGFTRAGFRVLLALDMDSAALRTYRLNHPSVPDGRVLCRDIRDLSPGELSSAIGGKSIDVLVGAPPCQGFSHAGFRSKRTHTGYRVGSDERNFLFEYMVVAALELRPRLFLMENVVGMQSARRKNLSFIETAGRMLEEKGGFSTAIWRINASAFGVPQDRIRYFLVASRNGELPQLPPEEYQDIRRQDFDVDALPPVTVDEAIFDLPPRSSADGIAVECWKSPSPESNPRLRRYLCKFRLLRNSRLIYNHTVRYHNKRDLELYALLRPGEDSIHVLERHGRADLMRYRRDVFDDKYAKLRGDRPSKTIVAHLAKDGNGYVHPSQDRSISVREAARLQSFHDGYAFCGSASDQWIQIGNAVPPVLAETIAHSFLKTLRRGRCP
jgi:DNA (cytosine-5)-methyltransferase 1